jgi:DNA-binding MarR family transcriptional regulator
LALNQTEYSRCTQAYPGLEKVFVDCNRELAPLGLTVQQLIAVGTLIVDENLSLVQFAKRLKTGKGKVSAMGSQLEALPLVTKSNNPNDARLTVLNQSDKERNASKKPCAALKTRMK